LRAALTEAAFRAAWAHGRSLDAADAVRYALVESARR
jgi:hypothetical protein